MSPDGRTALMEDLLGRARSIAEAAGGFLGLGAITEDEQRTLAELERAFG